jgi:hypothetical protein
MNSKGRKSLNNAACLRRRIPSLKSQPRKKMMTTNNASQSMRLNPLHFLARIRLSPFLDFVDPPPGVPAFPVAVWLLRAANEESIRRDLAVSV